MQTFLKEAKRKQKWMTFARIHRLACQRNNLPCAPSILKHHVSAEVCLLGPPVDFKRFFTLTRYLGKGSVTSIYKKPKDSLDNDYPRNEGRLANRFFPRNVLCMFLRDPTVKRQYPKSPPPPKKIDFFSDWVGQFDICFRYSKMTEPRPCPTGWAYFKALSRSTKTCRAQINNKLSTSKIDIF